MSRTILLLLLGLCVTVVAAQEEGEEPGPQGDGDPQPQPQPELEPLGDAAAGGDDDDAGDAGEGDAGDWDAGEGDAGVDAEGDEGPIPADEGEAGDEGDGGDDGYGNDEGEVYETQGDEGDEGEDYGEDYLNDEPEVYDDDTDVDLPLEASPTKKGRSRRCSREGVCVCVDRFGKVLYGGIKFPKKLKYTCKKPPTPCQKQKFVGVFNDEWYRVCNRKGAYVKKQCACGEDLCINPPPNSIHCGSVKIESKKYPGKFVAQRRNSVAVWLADRFHEFNVITPGLGGQAGTVSLQSASSNDKYLRDYNFNIVLESETDPRRPQTFADDATFILHENSFGLDGYVAFESVNIQACYIRAVSDSLKLSRDERTATFADEASWRIIPTGNNVPDLPCRWVCWCVDKDGEEIPGSRGDDSIRCKKDKKKKKTNG